MTYGWTDVDGQTDPLTEMRRRIEKCRVLESHINKYTHTQHNSTHGKKIIYVPKIISRFRMDTERMGWIHQRDGGHMAWRQKSS